MRALICIATILVGSSAYAQLQPCGHGKRCSSVDFTATTPTGTNAVNINSGATLNLNYPTNTFTIKSNGTQYELVKPLLITMASGTPYFACEQTTGGACSFYFDAGGGGYFGYTGSTWCIGTTASRGAAITSQYCLTSGGSWQSSIAGRPFTVDDAEGISSTGVATGSLAACNDTAAPSGTRGTKQFDSTTKTWKFCNGTAWKEFATGGAGSGVAQIVELSGDVTTNSGTIGDLTGLSWSVAANTTYGFTCRIVHQNDTVGGGFWFALNGPASPTLLEYTYQSQSATGTATNGAQVGGHGQGVHVRDTYDGSQSTTTHVSGANLNHWTELKGIFRNGANAGTMQVRFATDGTGILTVKAYSRCVID